MINNIFISNDTKEVRKDKKYIGVVGENGYEILKFIFDEFIDGIGILEIQRGENKYYVQLEKGDNCYLLEIKNSLLATEGKITMQLVVRQSENRVFKSSEFTMEVLKAIEATAEIPDEYETWDSTISAKIIEIDNKLEDMTDLEEDLENKVETGYFKGDKGDSGIVTFELENGDLIAIAEDEETARNYSIENGNLILEVE